MAATEATDTASVFSYIVCSPARAITVTVCRTESSDAKSHVILLVLTVMCGANAGFVS